MDKTPKTILDPLPEDVGSWLYVTFLAFPELKRIEEENSRQVSFSKRRSGLMKKASELSVLCDVDIGLFIFSGHGRIHEFWSGDRSEKREVSVAGTIASQPQ